MSSPLVGIIKRLCDIFLDHYPQQNRSHEEEMICKIYENESSGPARADWSMPAPSPAIQTILVLMYAAIMMISLVGNVLVISVFVRHKAIRSVTYVYIVNLAVSDLVTFLCIPFHMGIVLSRFWIFGDIICRALPFFQNVSFIASSLTLACIAMNRYYAIVHPLKCNFSSSRWLLPSSLATIWVVSLVISVPFAIMFEQIEVKASSELPTSKGVGYGDVYANYDSFVRPAIHTRGVFCMWPNDARYGVTFSRPFFLWSLFIAGFVVPLVLMTSAYVMIIRKLWNRKIIGSHIETCQAMRLRCKRRAIAMLVLVVFLFFVCYAPITLFTIAGIHVDMRITTASLTARLFLQALAASNACCNPVVYAIMHDKFRKILSAACAARSTVTPLPVKPDSRSSDNCALPLFGSRGQTVPMIQLGNGRLVTGLSKRDACVGTDDVTVQVFVIISQNNGRYAL